jgi:hypothetical protein
MTEESGKKAAAPESEDRTERAERTPSSPTVDSVRRDDLLGKSGVDDAAMTRQVLAIRESERVKAGGTDLSQVVGGAADRVETAAPKGDALPANATPEQVKAFKQMLAERMRSPREVATPAPQEKGGEKIAVVDRPTQQKVDGLVRDYLGRETDPTRRQQCIDELAKLAKTNQGVREAYGPMLESIKSVEEARAKGDPGVEARLNEMRTQFIVRELGPKSTPEDFKNAGAELEKESKAGNATAGDWKKWTDVNELVAKMSKSTSGSDVTKQIEALHDMVENGNPYARPAMTGVILASGDKDTVSKWLQQFPDVQGKPFLIPNLSGVKDDMRSVLFWASHKLTDVIKYAPMSRAETAAIAVGACAASFGKDDSVKEKLASLLQQSTTDSPTHSIKGEFPAPGREAVDKAFQGMTDVIKWQTPGSESLKTVYMRMAPGMPSLGKALPEIEQLALQNDKGALAVMAGVASGRVDKNPGTDGDPPAHERARRVLEEVGSRPGMRKDVVRIITEIQERPSGEERGVADKRALLATLGKISNDLSPTQDKELVERVRNVLIKSQDRNRIHSGPDDSGFTSALEGLANMPKHLTKSDVDLLLSPSRLRPEVVNALARNADAYPKETREYIVSSLKGILDNNNARFWQADDQKINALRAMGSFAKYLSKDEVDYVASFGQDARYNRGTDRIKQMTDGGFSQSKVPELKGAAAETLLHILATAPNSDAPGGGPREAAYKAFRDIPWPLPDGKGGFIPSHQSEKLKDALLKYYDGHPFDVGLASEINRIVDSAQLPRPAVDVIWKLGVGDPKNPHDPAIRERAERIVKNYDSPGENGQEVLRRVVANVERINTLPAYDRARLMGWNDMPEAQKKALGWVPEPTAEQKQKLNWDGLNDQQKEELRWSGAARVDHGQVLGQMYNNQLQNSPNANLLKDLSGQVEAMRAGRGREVDLLTTELANLNIKKRGESGDAGVLGDLADKTKEGVSFGRKVLNVFSNGRSEEFAQQQKERLEALANVNQKISETEGKLAVADRHEHQLRLANQVGEYQRLLNQGKNVDADKLAVSLWKEHGPALAQLAPGLWRDLTVNKDNTLQGACLLKRLHDRGLGQVDAIPSYAGGDPDGKPEDSARGFRQALGLEKSEHTDKPVGLMQLNRNEGLLDAAALRTYMLGRVDADPTLAKFSDAARQMQTPMEDLSKMFSAAQQGTIYENFIEVAKEKAGQVKAQMDKITEKDIRDLEGRITTMEQALRNMKADPSHSNEQAMKDLEDRIKTYKNMHNTFNRFDAEPKYKEVMDKTTDDSGKPINPNKQLAKMVDMVLDNGLQPSTLGSWLKQNGLLIGATVAAVAATVAACATFGITSPAAVGLWVAVGALAAREITNEGLYHLNKDGYTGWGQYGNQGSRIGAWGRQLENRTAFDSMVALGKDVVGPYAFEIARDWAAFVVTAGLSNYFVGGAESAKQAMAAVFRSPPPNLAQLAFQAQRASLIAEGQGTSALFMKAFLQNFGRELLVNAGFTGAALGAEQGIHGAIGPEQVAKMGEWGQFGLSFGISTALAMGQGALHGGGRPIIESATTQGGRVRFKLAPGANEAQVAEFYKKQGYEVKSTQPGQYEIRPLNAGAGFKPIVVENAARIADSQRPPMGEPKPTDIAAYKENFPQLTGKNLTELNTRISETTKTWTQDISRMPEGPAKTAAIEARRVQLDNVVQQFAKDKGLPALKLEIAEQVAGRSAEYGFGQGTIKVPPEALAAAGGDPALVKIAQHELAHAAQDKLIIEYCLKEKAGNVAEAQKLYEQMTKSNLNKEFAEAIKGQGGYEKLTPEQVTRAKQLAESVSKYEEQMKNPDSSLIEREAYAGEHDSHFITEQLPHDLQEFLPIIKSEGLEEFMSTQKNELLAHKDNAGVRELVRTKVADFMRNLPEALDYNQRFTAMERLEGVVKAFGLQGDPVVSKAFTDRVNKMFDNAEAITPEQRKWLLEKATNLGVPQHVRDSIATYNPADRPPPRTPERQATFDNLKEFWDKTSPRNSDTLVNNGGFVEGKANVKRFLEWAEQNGFTYKFQNSGKPADSTALGDLTIMGPNGSTVGVVHITHRPGQQPKIAGDGQMNYFRAIARGLRMSQAEQREVFGRIVNADAAP